MHLPGTGRKNPHGYAENDNRCEELKAELSSQIAALADGGVTGFLSGMALATDTWAAMAVLELREKNPALKLHCILPCMEQADKWSDSARERYHWILGKRISVVYVNRKYTRDCMMERNHFLVDYADMLLAVCDALAFGHFTNREAVSLHHRSIILLMSLAQLRGIAVSSLLYIFWDCAFELVDIKEIVKRNSQTVTKKFNSDNTGVTTAAIDDIFQGRRWNTSLSG